ncbi:site-specific integrase [Noviherbaspirillum sp. CPCC 100848]|uniref:Site-specific integrase n=1 Tax=Noviherbaspirillum album TaxID=3080276 RepID=A0ABU6JH84_9BURK|nr:site-specific integrase [Noviherbaspirillum sp. CPCC 100848]MEC4722778.1 site-specific integrase [Noviherbaspirillum sp. CPCC 100848]
MAKAPFIEDARLKHMLKVAGISGESPERNVALLYVIYGTGIMLTEVARMPVSRYLKPDGTLLEKSAITPEIAYNGKERPLWWSNAKVVAAIDKYLENRIRNKHGITTRNAAYRGLDPEGPLFLTGEGVPYKLIQRKTGTGAISYSCDSLSQLFRKLHLQAGIEGASAMSGRRTFAVRLSQKGYDLRHINELLGHETLTATKRLIDADPVRLGALVAGVI